MQHVKSKLDDVSAIQVLRACVHETVQQLSALPIFIMF